MSHDDGERPGDQPIELGDDDSALVEQLSRDRPVPSATFRGALGRHLALHDPGYGSRPASLWTMVAAYAAVGLLLILLGLLQAV